MLEIELQQAWYSNANTQAGSNAKHRLSPCAEKYCYKKRQHIGHRANAKLTTEQPAPCH